MEKIQEVVEKFNSNLESIDQIATIGSDTGEIAIEYLNSLKRQNENAKGFLIYKGKLDIVIQQISQIRESKGLKEKYQVIYGQATVLLVSGFESFISDLIVTLLDEYSEVIHWQKDDKKIVFEVGILKYKVPTIGEVVLRSLKNDFNFQDLQSTFKFFHEYLHIDLSKHVEKLLIEEIIKNQAVRHAIIHNSAIADEKFLKQIRNTEYSKQYSIGQKLNISEGDYLGARKSFVKLAEKIQELVLQKVNNPIQQVEAAPHQE